MLARALRAAAASSGFPPRDLVLLSGVPVLGSLLTTAAGAFDVRLFTFVVFVLIAKLVRNWLIVVVPLEIYRLFVR